MSNWQEYFLGFLGPKTYLIVWSTFYLQIVIFNSNVRLNYYIYSIKTNFKFFISPTTISSLAEKRTIF